MAFNALVSFPAPTPTTTAQKSPPSPKKPQSSPPNWYGLHLGATRFSDPPHRIASRIVRLCRFGRDYIYCCYRCCAPNACYTWDTSKCKDSGKPPPQTVIPKVSTPSMWKTEDNCRHLVHHYGFPAITENSKLLGKSPKIVICPY